ncbi:MAG TPA: Ig-like domain-containing protein [Planctomycetota bacterium]|nr:Ig-like domain-containing protein [Planctomycetota bacterium]
MKKHFIALGLGLSTLALLGVFAVRNTIQQAPTRSAARSVAETSAELAAPGATTATQSVASAQAAASIPATRSAAGAAQPQTEPLLPADQEDLSPGYRVDRATVVARHGTAPLTREHPQVAEAIEIQERHPELLGHPAVVGTAIGLNAKGEIALVVLTKDDAPGIPDAVEGLPVVVHQSGAILARDQEATKGVVKRGTETEGNGGTARFDRPVPIGVSTGHPAITAGTIGCRVSKSVNGTTVIYALSNNHVFANENSASIGDNEYQPGPYDGGVEGDTFANLSEFKTIIFGGSPFSYPNTIDAAIAAIKEGSLRPDNPLHYGSPNSNPTGAALGMAVTKVGRTTGETFGKITGINAKVAVGYDHGTGRYSNQIIIEPGTFSAGGDSGSLIVTDDVNRNPVGLLFAGSSSDTIANVIGNVLSNFSVTVDSSNLSPWVAISAPANGASFTIGNNVTFTATAQDLEDGALTGSSIVWTSSINGNIGTGTTFTTSALGQGTHTIKATATDSGGHSWSKGIQVTVGGASSGTVKVTTPSGTTGYALSGPKNKNLLVTVTLKDGTSAPVVGSSVKVSITNGGTTWTGTGTTGSGGTVTWSVSNAPSGTYTTTVVSVGAAGWDGNTPANSFTK